MNLAGYSSSQAASTVEVLPALPEPSSMDETNHRMANSLQFLSALVSIEARRIEDPAAIEIFERTLQRIGAIARVHRHLYSSHMADDIDLGLYISELCEDLEHLERGDASALQIRVETAAVTVSSSDAASIGIIVSELISNARKYAFGPGEQGEVRVTLQQKGSGGFNLEVSDRGRGFAAGSKPTGTGLGHQLISTLARRLRAEHDLHDNRPGTRFTLSVEPD